MPIGMEVKCVRVEWKTEKHLFHFSIPLLRRTIQKISRAPIIIYDNVDYFRGVMDILFQFKTTRIPVILISNVHGQSLYQCAFALKKKIKSLIFFSKQWRSILRLSLFNLNFNGKESLGENKKRLEISKVFSIICQMHFICKLLLRLPTISWP